MDIDKAIATLGPAHPLAIRHSEAKVSLHIMQRSISDMRYHLLLLEEKIINAAASPKND